MKTFLTLSLAFILSITQINSQQKTYCNPINIDYGYAPAVDFTKNGKHRATADPVIAMYQGDYYLFSTNQEGYWWSNDLYNWNFISRSFLKPYHHTTDNLCAPAVFVAGDTMFVIGSTYTQDFPLWMSTNPKANVWKEAVDSFKVGAWDPAFFPDENNKLYLYFGSSNVYPTYGVEINRKTFQTIGEKKELMHLNGERYGWHRFGEYLDNTFLDPFIEGSWMNKYHGKYFLQYGAPGTEFSSYGDGVMISDNPFGPFVPQLHNPFASKMGGFARGAGHGATFQDKWENWWHVSTIAISVKNNFERRLGLWPAGFDNDDVLYCNTAFGDYPYYLPQGPENHVKGNFTGWMLLNFNKPVHVSSTLGGYGANYAVDESIKTYWSAASDKKGEWIQTDLGNVSSVRAIQINYADQDAEFLGKQLAIFHQYILYTSVDGIKWEVLIDKSNNKTDIPHEYVELKQPVQSRFLKLENIHVPTGKFAISGLRVFGNGNGTPPDSVKEFIVLRTEKDKRSAWIKWNLVDNAYAYNLYIGIAPDKLYTCIMVYGSNEYYFKCMDKELSYYFTIEAINENGVSAKKQIIMVK